MDLIFMKHQSYQPVSLIPYILGFGILDISVSIMLGLIIGKSIGISISAIVGGFIVAHCFLKKNNRLLNKVEQVKIAFGSLLIVMSLSFGILYFLFPNIILKSSFKSLFFIMMILGFMIYKFVSNFLILKGCNYLLKNDKNYYFNEYGYLIEKMPHTATHFEGRTTQVPQQLTELLVQNKQQYHSQFSQGSKKRWLINISILLVICIIVIVIIQVIAISK